jgi:hypothetical protein
LEVFDIYDLELNDMEMSILKELLETEVEYVIKEGNPEKDPELFYLLAKVEEEFGRGGETDEPEEDVLWNEGGRWRAPTKRELDKAFDYLKGRHGGDPEKIERYAVVLENYVSDSPGYRGGLLFIVFGYPNAYRLFAFDEEGDISMVEPEWA